MARQNVVHIWLIQSWLHLNGERPPRPRRQNYLFKCRSSLQLAAIRDDDAGSVRPDSQPRIDLFHHLRPLHDLGEVPSDLRCLPRLASFGSGVAHRSDGVEDVLVIRDIRV